MDTLGLPCFCFQPDLVEAIKMLKDNSNSLNAYRQPISTTNIMSLDSLNKVNADDGRVGVINRLKGSMGRGPGAGSMNLGIVKSSIAADGDYVIDIVQEANSMPLARVLVWLMAPVAAEYLKYGEMTFTSCHCLLTLTITLNVIFFLLMYV